MAEPVIVVAYDEQRNIGNKGELPWPKIPEDARQFKAITSSYVVIMGRKTYESLPVKYRPLPNRINLVVTQKPAKALAFDFLNSITSPIYVKSIYDCMMLADSITAELLSVNREYYVIGGAEIYKQMMNRVNKIIASEIKGTYEGDCKFPELVGEWNREVLNSYERFDLVRYTKVI